MTAVRPSGQDLAFLPGWALLSRQGCVGRPGHGAWGGPVWAVNLGLHSPVKDGLSQTLAAGAVPEQVPRLTGQPIGRERPEGGCPGLGPGQCLWARFQAWGQVLKYPWQPPPPHLPPPSFPVSQTGDKMKAGITLDLSLALVFTAVVNGRERATAEPNTKRRESPWRNVLTNAPPRRMGSCGLKAPPRHVGDRLGRAEARDTAG